MREIKFRVWNGIEMVYDVTTGKFGTFYVNPDNNGIDRNDSASMTQLNTKYPDGIPLMQCTGLKDKNGVEIYEGDWLRICAGYSSRVEFQDGMFVSVYDHWEDPETIPLIDAIGKETEVVGNIHQTPELL